MPFKIVKINEVEPFFDQCGPVRAIYRNADVSMARLTMKPGSATKPHYHKGFTEVYVIESGNGVLTLDDESQEVGKGDLVEIQPNVVHQLINDGDTELELSITCNPPFNPEDIWQ